MSCIRPGIYQLKIPIPNNPLEHTNVYLLQAEEGYLLIDAGVNTDEALQSLRGQLAEIGLDLKDISQIVVTHVHGDHYGLVGKVRQISRAQLAFHDLEKDLVYPAYSNALEMFRQTDEWLSSNGVPASETAPPQATPGGMRRFSPPAPPDVTLYGGETIYAGVFNLQVVWTPGHSPGHICLYETTQKILFAGDHVLPVITPNISLRFKSDRNPLGEFLNSLRTVQQLDVALVLPAHEHPFTDLRKRVEELFQHHQQRCLEILETIRSETKTAYQISAEITWMPEFGGVRFRDLPPWDKRMAVCETLAHLEAMKVDGVVDRSARDGITYYQPA